MSGFRRFEDIKAWKLGRELTRQIYEQTREGAFARDFGLRDQIQRASVSITSNFAEGFERYSTAEFARFLLIARGSAAEVRSKILRSPRPGLYRPRHLFLALPLG